MAADPFRAFLLKLLEFLFEDEEEYIEASSTDINILLLGASGVGKTTFINAFANYLISNSMNEAINAPIEIMIPTSFNYTDPATYQDKNITIGEPDDQEKQDVVGDSCTRASRSFVFLINGKRVRFIDTPGVGDTRGVLQDHRNLDDMLAFINQLNHLNGICMLFKPDDCRATPAFLSNMKELFRRMHTNARSNLMFVFTHARTTFFKPGEASRMIREFIKKSSEENQTKIPFDQSNTFMFDNESFRFLALLKNGIACQPEEKDASVQNWQRSFNESKRLLQRILACKPHKVRESVSLNRIHQTIRTLSRPTAEVSRLIEQNKKLVADYLKDPKLMEIFSKSPVISQLDLTVIQLDYPRTVSTNKKFTEVVMINDLRHVNYTSHCHPRCYLRGVEEELVGDPKLKECSALDNPSGICKKCKCSWKEHMHITYELKQSTIEFELKGPKYDKLSPIEKLKFFIKELENEQKSIIEVSAKLMRFLKINSLYPVNDSLFDYIDLCVEQERGKKQMGASNDSVIFGLEQFKAEYQFAKERMDEIAFERIEMSDNQNSAQLEEMDQLIESLYKLPYNGKKIKEQTERLKKIRIRYSKGRQKTVDLSEKTKNSELYTEILQWTSEN